MFIFTYRGPFLIVYLHLAFQLSRHVPLLTLITPPSPARRQKSPAFSSAQRGRPAAGRGSPRASPAPGGAGAADVVDLTDDDDPKRPAGRGALTGSPRRGGGVTSVTVREGEDETRRGGVILIGGGVKEERDDRRGGGGGGGGGVIK